MDLILLDFDIDVCNDFREVELKIQQAFTKDEKFEELAELGKEWAKELENLEYINERFLGRLK